MKYVTGIQNDQSISELENRNRILAYRAACEGIVLLENNGVLPLKPGRIALYGAGAVNTVKGGTGSGEVNERFSVNIHDGLVNAGFVIGSEGWLADYRKEFEAALTAYGKKCRSMLYRARSIKHIMEVVALSFHYPCGRMITEEDMKESETDTAVYVVSRQSGEEGDRHRENYDYNLKPEELIHLASLRKYYRKLILVLNAGGPMSLEGTENIKPDALIWFCQQGEEGGNALGAVMNGSVSPSGKLASTWYRRYEDIYNGADYSFMGTEKEKEYYKEGIYTGYRYCTTFDVKPQFPFGYGLSYTDFRTEMLNIAVTRLTVSLEVTVVNTGKCSGKEVVQVYVSSPAGKLDHEYISLAGFA